MMVNKLIEAVLIQYTNINILVSLGYSVVLVADTQHLWV